MPKAEEPQTEFEAPTEAMTNFERLSAELPKDSLAAKLLHAWQSDVDPAMRLKRMLDVAQPPQTQTTEDPDAPTD